MAIRKPKPTSPGRRFATYADFAEITKTEPEKSLIEGLKKSGGRNARGRKTSRHRGGGAKRLYRKDRLQAPQGRHPGQGRRDRVRPQPHRLHRAAALRRRRQELHPRAEPPAGRRDRRVRARRADIAVGQLPAAGQHADRHRGPQRRARSPAAAASSAARPARRSSSWPRTATWRRCACRPARCAWSARSAARPSARSATPTTRTSRSARPAASATWACARRRAAPR